jgi:chemotaxis protein methyltransferase CheR
MDRQVNAASPGELEIRLLLEAIYLRFHYDFRRYAMASVRRRVAAALTAMGCETVSALQEKLFHDADAFPQLLRYLTVQVSDMFRDPPFFLRFRETIVPELKTYPSVKLWVAGCATGEEVYSYAIVLKEEGLLDRTVLYATDIDPEALDKARAGVFPIDRIPAFTENHRATGATVSLSTYYTAAYGAVRFAENLRSNVVFSDHSLATDSTFAEVHVVSCRNVLIYFDRELQSRALGLFRDALVRRGFLGLGSKETLQFTPHAPSFRELEGGTRWYQRW